MQRRTELRAARLARTLNQTDFGRIVGLRQKQVSRIEQGLLTPTAATQIKIAAVLGVPRQELFGDPERTAAVAS